MTVDRFFFEPGTTESFCDWRGRSIFVRQPQFFSTEVTKHKWLPTEVFSRMMRPKVFTIGATDARKCTPTEIFLRLARRNVFATGANDAKMNAD